MTNKTETNQWEKEFAVFATKFIDGLVFYGWEQGKKQHDTPYTYTLGDAERGQKAYTELIRQVRPLLDHQRQEIEKEKNEAYWERNQLVAALSKVFPSHLCRHPDEDKEWENDWRWIVCIHIPVLHRGPSIAVANPDWIEDTQVTWHIHDSEKPLFDHLEVKENHWDGHTTEEKYQRLSTLRKEDKEAVR